MISPRDDYSELLFCKSKENRLKQCAGRRNGTTHKLVHITSWMPNTEFAPVWDVPFWNFYIPIDFSRKILQDVKKLEDTIGDWKSYNIFSWKNPFAKKLQLLIKTEFNEYLRELDREIPEVLWIRGWMNILNPGENLPLHSHSFHENTFVSGNILLNGSEVSTEYVVPNYSTYYGNYLSNKKEGSAILFPSWVEHFVPKISLKRYCLAFDIYTDTSMKFVRESKNTEDPMHLSIMF